MNYDYKLHEFWDRIEEHFAKINDVKRLAKELKELEAGIDIRSSQVATTAAGMVIKALRHEIDKLGHFNIEIVPFTDKHGFPGVSDPQFNKMYLTPSLGHKKNYEWKKWIVVPVTNIRAGEKNWKWERVGQEEIDLRWVNGSFDEVNEALKKLNHKIEKSNKILTNIILNKAIRPIEDLKNFIVSDQYIQHLVNTMPKAALNQDGLMTGGQFALLNALAVWASQDHKYLGGGALGEDYVEDVFAKETILQNHATNKK